MSISKSVKQIEVRDSVVEGLIVVNYLATGNSTYYTRGTTKKRRRVKLGTSHDLTLKQARKKAAETLSLGFAPHPLTLTQVFELYAKSGEYSGKLSINLERLRFEKAFKPMLGGKNVKAISLKDVQAVMGSLDPSFSDATRNRYLSGLRSVFRFSADQGYSDNDPSRSIKLRAEVQAKLYEVTDEFIGLLALIEN